MNHKSKYILRPGNKKQNISGTVNDSSRAVHHPTIQPTTGKTLQSPIKLNRRESNAARCDYWEVNQDYSLNSI